MYIARGLYASYRQNAVPRQKAAPAANARRYPENVSPRVPQAEPFMFTRLFLVFGILLAGIAVAAMVSG